MKLPPLPLEQADPSIQKLVKSIDELTKIKKEKLLAKKEWMKTMGKTPRGKKLLAAQEKFMDAFFTPVTGFEPGQSQGTNIAFGDEKRMIDDVKNYDDYEKSFGDAGRLGSVDDFQTRAQKEAARQKGMPSRSFASVSGKTQEEATLMDLGQSSYDRLPGEGLFEIVTKAYFRNYRRLDQ